MDTIERGNKKALSIEAPFESDTNVFKMYLDICETAGMSLFVRWISVQK